MNLAISLPSIMLSMAADLCGKFILDVPISLQAERYALLEKLEPFPIKVLHFPG